MFFRPPTFNLTNLWDLCDDEVWLLMFSPVRTLKSGHSPAAELHVASCFSHWIRNANDAETFSLTLKRCENVNHFLILRKVEGRVFLNLWLLPSVDHSRICLQLGANDYINASLITVEETQRNYILTQVRHTSGRLILIYYWCDYWQVSKETTSVHIQRKKRLTRLPLLISCYVSLRQ